MASRPLFRNALNEEDEVVTTTGLPLEHGDVVSGQCVIDESL